MKPGFFRWLKIVLTLAVLGLLLFKIKPETITTAIRKVEIAWLLVAMLLGLSMVIVRWMKWHLLVRAGLGSASSDQTLASLLGGMAFALVTPARVGELSRVAFLKNGSRAEASGLVLVDRFIDLSVVLIFGAIGLSVVFGTDKLPWLLLAIAFLIFCIFKLDLFLALGIRILPIKKLQELIAAAATGLGRLSNSALAINLGLTILLTALDVVSLYVLVRALGATNFKAVVFVYPLIMLTNLAPITISGLGVRESTSVMLFAMFAIPQPIAFNATFLSYLLNSLTPALLGIYFFRKLRQN